MALPRTEAALEAIERAVCEANGDLRKAAAVLQINLYELHQWLHADPEAANRVKQAQLVGWSALETEAYRRAVEGHNEPVYFKGRIVGYRKVYSDGLLQTMLKARVPGYAAEDAGHGVTVNVNLMPRATSYEEWLEQKGQSALQLEHKQDNEPIVDAEYEDVTPVTGLRDVL